MEMMDIPEHIREQIHILAADGMPLEEISFMLRLDQELIEAELQSPTVSVNTTDDDQGSAEDLNDAAHKDK